MGKMEQTNDLQRTVTELTINQVTLLNRIINAPNQSAVFSAKADGGTISTLSKLGLVEKFGKVGSAVVWKASPNLSPYRKLLRTLEETGRWLE